MKTKIHFKDGKATTISPRLKSKRDSDGNRIGQIREIEKDKLWNMLPEELKEGCDSQGDCLNQHYSAFKLEDGELVFDEGFEPESESD